MFDIDHTEAQFRKTNRIFIDKIACSHSDTHTHTLSLSHTHSLIHTHTHTRSYTYPQSVTINVQWAKQYGRACNPTRFVRIKFLGQNFLGRNQFSIRQVLYKFVTFGHCLPNLAKFCYEKWIFFRDNSFFENEIDDCTTLSIFISQIFQPKKKIFEV